jgi:hypothetical protein
MSKFSIVFKMAAFFGLLLALWIAHDGIAHDGEEVAVISLIISAGMLNLLSDFYK